jgi:phage baseplate assembly protein gpV
MKDFSSLVSQGSIAQAGARTSQPGESSAIARGQVSTGADPLPDLGLQRVTAVLPGKAGLVEQAPASRPLPCPYWNPPQPVGGMTALIGAIGGDPHNLATLGIELNRANQAPPKQDLEKDDSRYIPGRKTLLIVGEEVREVRGGVLIISGSTRVQISPDGTVSIEAATVSLSGDLEVGGDLSVAGDVALEGLTTIGGNEAMVIGGQDTGGDTMSVSGQ